MPYTIIHPSVASLIANLFEIRDGLVVREHDYRERFPTATKGNRRGEGAFLVRLRSFLPNIWEGVFREVRG